MRVVHEHCAGLDVHKKTVVACVITPEGRQVRTFSTMTEELLALTEWLQQRGCRVVAMESTGVYWKPVYNLLEAADLEPMVVNAQHIKAVPGRKTDVRDAEWIAELLRHGLLRASFIPDRPQRELRELVRYRRSLVQERVREGRLAPFEPILKRLETIPGVGRRVAEDLIAEIGTDMSRFPTHRHLASWAKLCPGNRRSGGKAKPEHVGGRKLWVRALLVEAARAAGRSKDTFLAAQYHRLARRIGDKRAAVAVAHTLVVIAYHVVRDGEPYHELGANFHDQRSSKALVRRLTHRLEELGYDVNLQLKEAA